MSKKQLILDYKEVFNGRAGKEVLADLRRRCPLIDDSINTNKGIDVNKLLVLEGQRSVLIYIYKMIHADPYEERPKKAIQRQGE